MGDPSMPLWVVNVREEIGRSPAWEVLSDQLYERVSIVLRSHGLGHFSDLSSAEQITLLEEAHREIMSENNKVYQAFESQFSKSMDAEIAKEARIRIDQDEGAKRDGADEALYLDRILEAAAEGAVALLRELPREHLGSLRLMLNQPIPSRARLEIWKLLLRHTSAREDYEQLMKQNRNSTMSGQDIYITHRCQALLESGRVATCRLLPLTSRNVVLMKTVLSHHHACKMSKRGEKATMDVPESYVHFLVPLCAVITRGEQFSSAASAAAAAATAGAPLREQKIELMIEDLVEMFESGLEAGLKGLVDPRELAGGGGSGPESVLPRGKKSGSTRPTMRVARAGRGVVESAEDSGDKGPPPAWVEVAHAALVPGFKCLVDHVTRVHLGLAVTVVEEAAEGAECGDGGGGGDVGAAGTSVTEALPASKVEASPASKAETSPPSKSENDETQATAEERKHDKQPQDNTTDGDGSPGRRKSSTLRASLRKSHMASSSTADAGTASNAAIPEHTGSGKTDTSSDRRRSSTRRASLKARRASSSSADAGAGNATSPEGTGDGNKPGDAPPMRHPSSLPTDVITEEKEKEEDHMVTAATKSSEDVPSKSVALAEVDPSQARAALWALLKPMVTVGLVGHLGAEACLFAWDQAVVGGFGVMLPRVAAMVVAAAREKLEACATFAVMCEALLSYAQLLSTIQIQELLEDHCIPAIREEMRVSEKLSPTIIGPTLKAATEILHSAYSKRTREAQEARKAHVEHVLGPTGGPERDGRSQLLRLDVSRSRAEKHREGGGEGKGNGEEDGGLGDDAPQLRNGNGNDEQRQINRGGSRFTGKNGANGHDGNAEVSDERSARVKATWRGLPSHRGTSDSDAVKGENRSRRAGKNSDADAADGGNIGKAKGAREPAKRDASRQRASRDRKPQRKGEATAVAKGGGAATAVPRSRRRSSVPITGDSGAVRDKRKGGKRLSSTNSETAKGETVKNGISGGRRAQPSGGGRPSSGVSTSRGGSSSLASSASMGLSRDNSSRENGEEANQARASTGQKGRRKRRQSLEEAEDGGGRPAGSKAVPRTRNQAARRSVVAVDDDDDISSEDDISTPDGGSTPGQTPGRSGSRRGGGGSGRQIGRGREGNNKRRQKVSEADEVEKAQLEVYKRVYTDEQIDALSDTEREAFDKKQPKFEKALRSLRAAREAEERREDAPPSTASKTKKSSKNKSDAKKEGLEEGAAGDKPPVLPPKKEKPAPPVWEEEGETEFSPIPASSLATPRSPLKRWFGIGGRKTK